MSFARRHLSLIPLLGLMSSLFACGGGSTPIATSFDIGGTVSGAASVTMTLSGAATATTTTGASGSYRFAALPNGSYTVTPSLAGYTFVPRSVAVIVNGSGHPSVGFAATVTAAATYGLSGAVSGVVTKDVMVTLNGAATGSVFTDAAGNYAFTGLPNGTYTVTLALPGYAFSAIATVVISNADSTGNNSTSTVAPSGSNLRFTPLATLSPHAQKGVHASIPFVTTGSTTGGTPPYHYQSDSFMTGAPPIGMVVDLNGNVTGTPAKEGTYSFGVCAVDLAGASSCANTTLVVDPAAPLTGSWVGSWAWSGTGSNGCSFSDGGAFSLDLVQTGDSFSGTSNGSGIEIRDNATCALMTTESGVAGTASGTISGTSVSLSFDLTDSYGTLSFSGTATLGTGTLVANFTRSTGGTGTFTLTKQ